VVEKEVREGGTRAVRVVVVAAGGGFGMRWAHDGRILRAAAVLATLFLGLGTAGCSTHGGMPHPGRFHGAIDPSLPDDPEPCAQYCKCWVPAKCREVPKLCMVCPGHTRCDPVCVNKTVYCDECVKPRTCRPICIPGSKCDETIVQTSAGGYRWIRECNCWKYCYVPPCFQYCNKSVTENGVRYCSEEPPVYRTTARTCPRIEYRTTYVPPRYEVRWVKEVYDPAHWEWQRSRACCDCICPCDHPEIPKTTTVCPPPCWTRVPRIPNPEPGCGPCGVAPGCPCTN
jgi:hypothetical protein